MPAVSKAQQKFFGIVRAIQKGEMAPTSPETAKAAAEMKKKDVKDFASTKHKGLPNKKEVEEVYYGGEEQRRKDEKKAKYEKQLKKMLPKRAFDSMGRELDPRSGKLKEVNEIYSGTDSGRAEKIKKYDAEKKKFAKDDKRKKFGKFVQDVERVRSKSKGMRGTHKGKWGTFNKGVFTPDN